MKTLHVPFGFFPDPVGGTEVYVASLAAALAAQGHPAVIAAPAAEVAEYRYDNLPVHRFAVPEAGDIGELYDGGSVEAASAFGAILERERPDVVHLHAFTRACSIELVRAAHRRGVPVVFTYHTPSVACQRGTLMRWGRTPCDGVLNVRRCAACSLHALGVPAPLAHVLAATPRAVGRRLAATHRSGGPWTALRYSALMSDRHLATHALFGEVDRIVALCDWTVELLLANGVPAGKIGKSTHGLSRRPSRAAVARSEPAALRIAFLGRFDKTKGLDTLIRAFERIPQDVRVSLDVFGVTQGAESARESEAVRALAGRDARIRFLPPLEPRRVIDALTEYDLLAVPSRWMETGPLVVLEAFAAGVPVVGSALGGIADLVQDGVNGRLVSEYESPDAWAKAIDALARRPGDTAALRRGIRPPKTMDAVAREMLEIYRGVMSPAGLCLQP